MVHMTCWSRVLLRRKFLFRSVAISRIKPVCWYSLKVHTTFKFSDLEVQLASPEQLQPKPDVNSLQFGKYFTDHMLKILYHRSLGGWQRPRISPFENIALHPAAKVLHYAIELFEGMKAYRGVDGRIRMFRPELNMERMNLTAERAGLPTFDGPELVQCLARLLAIDQEWVPHSEASSLYIRPTLIGIDPSLGVASSESALLYVILCPVGPYFGSNVRSVSLMADPQYTRAWPGGVGNRKMGSNYAPTIQVQSEAQAQGLQQVLWLYGPDDLVTEVGLMNIFMFFINEHGEKELATPPLDGLILPGVTRASILELAREWGEFTVSERPIRMAEVCQLSHEKRLLEMFGAGTAAVVSPIDSVSYKGEVLQVPTLDWAPQPVHTRFLQTLSDIHYGRLAHPWAVPIEGPSTLSSAIPSY